MIGYMSFWAVRRQFTYLAGIFLFIGIIVFIILYPRLTRKPTCSDAKQNGTELGIDCGGICDRLCQSQVSEPVILWSRAFHVVGGLYNLVAYVENQNKNGAVQNAQYEFRVYDTNNLLIGRREGSTFIPPNQRFAVFESRFDAGKSTVKTVTFEMKSPFEWVKKNPTIQTLPIHVDRILLGSDPASPTLSARMTNDSIYDLPAFDVITILYNAEHNAINASKTYRDGLPSGGAVPLLFTWPEPFSEAPITEDVLPQINPFTTSF